MPKEAQAARPPEDSGRERPPSRAPPVGEPAAAQPAAAEHPEAADPGRRVMLSMRDVRKTYLVGEVPVRALRGVDLDIYEGEMVAVTGPSGSGKSTLLHIMGGLDTPTRGRVRIRERLVSGMGDDDLARLRGKEIGFVFQSFNLYPTMNAWQNVALPMMAIGTPRVVRRARALKLLEHVGLKKWSHHMPTQLSGGQKQRVAVARALANRPAFLLADEPTGNLDSTSSKDVIALLRQLHREGKTIVIVTHDPEVAVECQRTIVIRDGRVERATPPTSGPRQAAAFGAPASTGVGA